MFRFLSNVGSKILTSLCKNQFPSIQPPAAAVSPYPSLLIPPATHNEQVRTVIKYSMKNGTRKSVLPVLKRFFRLNWGIWIRTRAGRHRRMWAKSITRRNRLREHVFCNATQSKLLDRMACEFWRRPKYYVEDPYTPYHNRENFLITRKRPWRPEGWE